MTQSRPSKRSQLVWEVQTNIYKELSNKKHKCHTIASAARCNKKKKRRKKECWCFSSALNICKQSKENQLMTPTNAFCLYQSPHVPFLTQHICYSYSRPGLLSLHKGLSCQCLFPRIPHPFLEAHRIIKERTERWELNALLHLLLP